MASLRSILVLLVGVALSGCTGAAREPYLRETLDLMSEHTMEGAFLAENGLVWLAFFNLTEDGWAESSFEVGDGGRARGCFFSQRGVNESLELVFAPKNNKEYEVAEEFGCSGSVAAAEAGVVLPAGAYAFALYSRECPRLDCGYGVDVRHDGDRSSTHAGEARWRFGRIDGAWLDDPAYPPEPNAGPHPTPVAVEE